MPVFKLTIEYDGTPFSGWQSQEGQRTVQGTIEDALGTILRAPHSIQGASRTDAGVHARGQVASLKTDVDIEPMRLAKSLCALCAPSISVTNIQAAAERFNARFDSKGKRYGYRVLNRSAPSPLQRNFSWHVHSPLDLSTMRRGAASLLGTHDFAGFRASDCGRDNTVRELTKVEIRDVEELLEIEVQGTAFLKNMVRIIAGTLVDIGRGALEPDAVTKMLETGDRTLGGKTAPAKGLTLEEVFY